MAAMREFFQPLSGSSAATIIIFTPMAFLSGVTGAFFKSLSLTMAASLIISFLMAWLAVPLLAAHLLRAADAQQEEGGALDLALPPSPMKQSMRRLLRRHWLVLLGIVPLLALGWLAYQHLGSGFMPKMDEGGFIIDYHAPPGHLPDGDRPPGAPGGGDPRKKSRRWTPIPGAPGWGWAAWASPKPIEGDFFVRLKPLPRKPIETVMDEVRGRSRTHGARLARGNGPTDGGLDRRSHRRAPAHRDQDLFR